MAETEMALQQEPAESVALDFLASWAAYPDIVEVPRPLVVAELHPLASVLALDIHPSGHPSGHPSLVVGIVAAEKLAAAGKDLQ